MRLYSGVALAVLFNSGVWADDAVQVRPHAGIGKLDSDTYRHAGLRLLLNANAEKKYGFELTRISSSRNDYIAAGIVLEQKKAGWFNMSIGTVSYFGQGDTQMNQPGLVANLGWEPDTSGAFKPFVTLRNDVIFVAGKTQFGNALSAGLSVGF
jgi:hypothetical protein